MSHSLAEITAAKGDLPMDRNQTPTKTSIVLSDHEFAARAAPGRLPVKGAKNTVAGDPKYTPIGSGSPAAIAGQSEHEIRRAKPELVARREAKGK
jgi:hypothetical protein